MSRHELHFYDALLVELISTLLMIFDHIAFNRATVWRLEFETAQCGRSVLSTLKFWSLHGNLIGIEAIIEICFITNELTIVLIQLSYDYVNCAMHKAPNRHFQFNFHSEVLLFYHSNDVLRSQDDDCSDVNKILLNHCAMRKKQLYHSFSALDDLKCMIMMCFLILSAESWQ